MALADVMLPEKNGDGLQWHMIEVKSSTSVKDYYREDLAVQAYIATTAGIDLASASVAHVDNSFVYPGGGDYQGLLKAVDLTAEANAMGQSPGCPADPPLGGPREPWQKGHQTEPHPGGIRRRRNGGAGERRP